MSYHRVWGPSDWSNMLYGTSYFHDFFEKLGGLIFEIRMPNLGLLILKACEQSPRPYGGGLNPPSQVWTLKISDCIYMLVSWKKKKKWKTFLVFRFLIWIYGSKILRNHLLILKKSWFHKICAWNFFCSFANFLISWGGIDIN